MDHGSEFRQGRFSKRRERPQPEHRISLTLAVTDPAALWAAAAAKLICAPDTTMEDVLDVIGPREDPSIISCIAAIAKPIALAGCVMDDFWIDSLRGSPPRIDIAGAVLEYKLQAAELSPRRASHKRRPAPHLALCMLPPLQCEVPSGAKRLGSIESPGVPLPANPE